MMPGTMGNASEIWTSLSAIGAAGSAVAASMAIALTARGQEEVNFHKATEFLNGKDAPGRIAGAQMLMRLHRRRRYQSAVEQILLEFLRSDVGEGGDLPREDEKEGAKAPVSRERVGVGQDRLIALLILFRRKSLERWYQSDQCKEACKKRTGWAGRKDRFCVAAIQLGFKARDRMLEAWDRLRKQLVMPEVNRKEETWDLNQTVWRNMKLVGRKEFRVFPRVSLRGADFSGAQLEELDLSACEDGTGMILLKVEAEGVVMPKKLISAKLSGTFERVDFSGCQFKEAEVKAKFFRCNFSQASFPSAHLGGQFTDCNFKGAIFDQTNMENSKMLGKWDLSQDQAKGMTKVRTIDLVEWGLNGERLKEWQVWAGVEVDQKATVPKDVVQDEDLPPQRS